MKLVLVVAFCCLAIHSGHGAPRTAVYKYVKCNPNGDQANCVTYQSPKMPWSSDLPNKIPASEAQFLEAEAVEDEELSEVEEDQPLEEEEEEMMQDEEYEDDYEEELIGNEYEDELKVQENDEDEEEEDNEDEDEEEREEEVEDEEEEEEDKIPLLGEEGESPTTFLSEVGSGSEEGSGSDITDRLFLPFGGDVGSGDSLNEEPNPAARHIPSLRSILKVPATVMKKAAEKELKDDHLLNL